MSIFDGLPDPSAPAQAFFTGLQHGKQQRQEEEVRGALSAYVANPDDPKAFATLAQWKPEFALKVREDQTKRAKAAQLADLQTRAAAGDKTAMAQLAGVDYDTYDKMADNQRQDLHARVDAIGNAALDISQRPPEQRAAAWDAYIDQLSPQYPELAPLKGQYSEEKLNAAIAQAGQTKEHLDSLRPHYTVLPNGADMVNDRDPAAVAAIAARNAGLATATPPVQVKSIAEAHALPPGTQFIDPNGVHRVVPGGTGGNVSGGFPGPAR